MHQVETLRWQAGDTPALELIDQRVLPNQEIYRRYDVRAGAYWVPIEGQWMQVPERAVIRDQGNPVGEAVVWYVHHRGSIIISCFVPADAV